MKIKKDQKSYDLLANIQTARSDLERAEMQFNEVTEQNAVEYAVYSILAAKARYSYLMSLAKQEGVKF